MQRIFTLSVLFTLLLVTALNAQSINKLSIKTGTIDNDYPAFIDSALLVVEPHGGYLEQSLYLRYSDHGQAATSQNLEIVHYFTLPEDAVVNDLWLWIGDDIMQARILDTWTARGIYDSIVANKKDPAFLAKNGNQYELRVYPLQSGSFRKIKMNYIVPTEWDGGQTVTELPLDFLKAGNNSQTPLHVLFRYINNVWGEPAFDEAPGAVFDYYRDMYGYRYLDADIPDVRTLSDLHLRYSTTFFNGMYYTATPPVSDTSFFQLGIEPQKYFGGVLDSSNRDFMVGIDFSGISGQEPQAVMDNISGVLKSVLREEDRFKMILTGSGEMEYVASGWTAGNDDNISAAAEDILASAIVDSMSNKAMLNILYCDFKAIDNFGYNGIEEEAEVLQTDILPQALPELDWADVAAAYNHGYERPMTDSEFDDAVAAFDEFFAKGGRFVTYFDFNRNTYDRLAKHYIPGLNAFERAQESHTLYRDVNGNFGSAFPESFVRQGTYFFEYGADPDVSVELKNSEGNPAVISKKIGNGLLVVSGMWMFGDDLATKTALIQPMLGLKSSAMYHQTKDLLAELHTAYQADPFGHSVVFSSDQRLETKNSAETWASSFMDGFGGTSPQINTVNLLDAEFEAAPYVTIDFDDYYGSGYLLQQVAAMSGGAHFEMSTKSWQFLPSEIVNAMNSQAYEELDIQATVDGGLGEVFSIREIEKDAADFVKPRFFIGAVDGTDEISFRLSLKFRNRTNPVIRELTAAIGADTTLLDGILPAMLAQEQLREMFTEASYDTVSIVHLAMRHRLLTDYTAFIALEPDDTLSYMDNPDDESDPPTSIEDEEWVDEVDSLSLDVFPNPFNSQTSVTMSLPEYSEVTITVYNILGQKVREIAAAEVYRGRRTFRWHGNDAYNRPVSSGIYLMTAHVRTISSGAVDVQSRKVMLLK